MEKRQKKILLLSIFGGAAVLLVVGYFAFLFWALAKAFPDNTVKDTVTRFIQLMECQSNFPTDKARSQKCVTDWLAEQKNAGINKKREENPELNACIYEQEVLLEALSATKKHGEESLNEQIASYCEFLTVSVLDRSGYIALKKIKNDLASQAILNYRYSQFKKKNYTLELEALNVYRDLANGTRTCDELNKEISDLNKRGSIFILGSDAICKLQACRDAKLESCPEAVKLGQRMLSQGDIAGDFILMHEAAMVDTSVENTKAVKYASQALLKGYTDVASNYDIIHEDFYKIKFTPESLVFSAARLANAEKIYTPALNCVAASLNKDWEFETLLKTPQTFSKQQWSEKITDWANSNSELLLRVACEVLTDVDSKIRIHEFYMNDGNEDGSAFDFCKMIQDPLFKDICTKDK